MFSVSRRGRPEASPAPLFKTASAAASVTGTGPVALRGAETVSPSLSLLSVFVALNTSSYILSNAAFYTRIFHKCRLYPRVLSQHYNGCPGNQLCAAPVEATDGQIPRVSTSAECGNNSFHNIY